MRNKLVTIAMLFSLPVSAQMPAFLNSNDVDNALPQPNVPADTYRPSIPSVSISQPQQQQLPLASLIYLKNIQIEGGSVYEFEEIAALFTDLVERTITLGDLLAATEKVTKRYQDDGYALSYAYLPQQNLLDGDIVVTIVEGYISEHQVVGEVGPVEKRILAMAKPLLSERPLKRETFERYTSLMSQIPGVRLVANVEPPKTTDGAVMLVTEARRRAFNATASLDKSKGEDLQMIATVVSNSQTSAGEQVAVSALVPPGDDNERYFRLDYGQYVSNEGTRFETYVSSYESDPEQIYNVAGAKVDLSRENKRASIGLTHPFKVSGNEIIAGTARLYGVDDERVYTRLTPLPVVKKAIEQESKVRVLALEGSWKQADNKQLRILSAGLYQGLDALGAKSELRVLGGAPIEDDYTDLDFTKLRISGMQSNKLADNWQGVVSGAVYWSEDSLPESEQVIFGDRNFGRGYPSDQAYGDKGWGAGYELNYSFRLDQNWMRLVQPYAALDAARTWYNLGGVTSRLSSAAVGVRLADQRFYNLGLELAKPLGDKAIDSRDRGIRYGVTLSYSL